MKTYILFLFMSLFSSLMFSQTSSTKYVKVKYFYVIDNVNSESQLNELKADFLQIKGVDEVKFEYKPEKKRARAIIYTTQKVRQSESDDEFRITALKQAVLKHNMTPFDFSEEIIND
ncbi:MAG: hypothetical protein N2449_04240 [Bacteroidales bacterium]|nr:hypothetical protein [Bacteroidales bacterium]